MKPPPFDYIAAESFADAAEVLSQVGEDGCVLAGGQSLMPMLNLRLTQPTVVVDITGIADARYIARRDGQLVVGAGVTQARLEAWPELRQACPLLERALPHIGHLQTRSRGTICGSLCHADPSSELPLILAVLGGEVVLRSATGERQLKAEDFQIGTLMTSRRPDEVMAEACFPLAVKGQRFGFREVTRRHGDFAILALACIAEAGRITLGVGGITDRPAVKSWEGLSEADVSDALNDFAWEMGGYDDHHASAKYRRELVRRLGLALVREVAEWKG